MGTLAWYLWAVLVEVGAMPIMDHDVLTGRPLEPSDVYGFSAELGGVTQDPISQVDDTDDLPRSVQIGVWRIRSQTVEYLNSLGQSPPVERFLEQSADQNLRVVKLFGAYIRERTGTEISAFNWLQSPIEE